MKIRIQEGLEDLITYIMGKPETIVTPVPDDISNLLTVK
jgi:hypothetical protein